MKNLTTKMMIAAAALVVAAGVAGAQTIKAEVPFGFRVAGTVMPAGSYRVNANTSAGVALFTLTNEDTHHSIMTLPYAHNIQNKGETAASLTFECSGSTCALVSLAPGSGDSYKIWKPKMEKGEDSRLAVIRAVLVNAR
ncbi:MAG TPA: hypothetical protein VNY05_01090 [Candidatus Acidoferrales bacterium]|jgi:hypothetical protein|nr:hypothetical protein [Candidatus Acidoferrales bacterium]